MRRKDRVIPKGYWTRPPADGHAPGMNVELFGPREVPRLRRAGQVAAATLAHVGARIAEGITTADIDAWVREDTAARGGAPSQLGYQGFPAAVCTSRNHVVCHGIPSRGERLAQGDIVNVDVTTRLDGFHGDTSATFFVGEPSAEARHVVRVARACRDAGIGAVRDGGRLGDIGAAVEELAHREGCTVVRELGGHGIRAGHARAAARPASRAPRHGGAAPRGDGDHRRADDQPGRRRGALPPGRLDGGDRGREPVGPVRAHGAGDPGGLRGADGAGAKCCWGVRVIGCCPPMGYENFTLDDVKQKLGLSVREAEGLFADVSPSAPSAWLEECLREGVSLALAVSTEKARSEWIVAPILLEVRRRRRGEIALFSGTSFNVDDTRGLTGFCDWIITHSPEQLAVEAPVVALVEAKNEDFRRGVPQCIAEMYAGRVFNERRGRARDAMHGVVTTGNVWRFLRLRGDVAEVDMTEIYIHQIDRILGVLLAMTA